jgi:hypothetical protein
MALGALITVSGPAVAQDLFVAGPLEQVDRARSTVAVLGQDIAVSREQLVRLLAAKSDAAGATIQVIVVGSSTHGRITAKKLIIQDEPYVAGASSVALSGYISKVSAATGIAKIGRLAVDINGPGRRAKVGDLVEIAGTQPNGQGALLATEIRKLPAGSIGSGTNGSIGSGTNGSIGSGTNGSIGSGTNGSIGSGTNGSIGSGTNGSIGSGTNGSIGSGTNGSIGSGTNGSIGSGTNGSIGSGTNGSIGSGSL